MERVSQEMVDSAYKGITDSIGNLLGEIDILQASIEIIKESVSNIKVVWNTEGGKNRSAIFEDIVGYLEVYSQEIAKYSNSLGFDEIPNISISSNSQTITETLAFMESRFINE